MPPLRVAFLGPAGTFSEDALRAATARRRDRARSRSRASTRRCSRSPRARRDRALVPFENAIEGSVRPTLDTLAFEARGVTIAGEHDHPIRHALIARTELELDAIEMVVSHPQPSAQCARFLRQELPGAELRAADSTADAVREVSESERPWAALGAASAAEIYGCVVLRDGIEDEHDNVTRFVWIAPDGVRAAGNGEWRTTLIFSELGADHPGALVDALHRVRGSRGQPGPDRVPPAAHEARPLHVLHRPRRGGHRPVVAEAIGALRGKAENVRVLGSYPISPDRASLIRVRILGAMDSVADPEVAGVRHEGRLAHRSDARWAQRTSRPRRAGPGPQRELRADQRLHDAPRRGARPQGARRGARARRGRAALRAARARAALRDPADALRPRARATSTAARSRARPSSPATPTPASTAGASRAASRSTT